MGLDMYLIAKARPVGDLYLNKEFEKYNPNYIAFDIGYWRKANSIHGWFDRNLDGVENCVDSCDLNLDDLLKLKKVCEELLSIRTEEEFKKAAMEKLPPMEGPFFGATNLDDENSLESYICDLKDTVRIIDSCEEFNKKMDGNCWFVYRAWW